MKITMTAVLVATALLAAPFSSVHAQSRAQAAALEERMQQLDARLERLERLLESEALVELMRKVDGMDRDVRELRGESETLRHELEGLRTRQRDLYLDVDGRLENLERGGASAPTPTSGATPATLPDGPAAAVTPEAGDSAAFGEAIVGVDSDPASEQAVYQAAFELLRQGRYEPSITAFRGFLERFPNGSLASNAQYWIAEAYYVTRDFPRALTEFKRVNERYPGSNKQADALLKQGFTHYELEQWAEARRALTQVRDQNPNSSVARLAEQRLRRMNEEGRP